MCHSPGQRLLSPSYHWAHIDDLQPRQSFLYVPRVSTLSSFLINAIYMSATSSTSDGARLQGLAVIAFGIYLPCVTHPPFVTWTLFSRSTLHISTLATERYAVCHMLSTNPPNHARKCPREGGRGMQCHVTGSTPSLSAPFSRDGAA